jgi:hypothetical protein
MSGVLEQYLPRCKIISSTIDKDGYGETEIDFLKTSRTVDAIVTNPPYRLAQEFVEHALECATSKVAMLLKIQFLEGYRRLRLFRQHPPKMVYVFSRRLTIYRNGIPMKNSGMICYAWFVWEKAHTGKPQIDWIPDAPSGSS